MSSIDSLVEKIRSGDRRSVARAISLIESEHPSAPPLLHALYPYTGKLRCVGITGAPGAGKSTLVDSVTRLYLQQSKKTAILAIDPSSPFSGGALLGDRIRMSRIEESEDAYIRSMATRGALGGIADAAHDVVQIFDAAGYAYLFIETVGVGQSEIEVTQVAQTVIVTLVPGMGDSVQSLKAGILEIADIFVINKSDREGADHVARDLRILLSLTDAAPRGWTPPIIMTSALHDQGITEVCAAIDAHQSWLQQSPLGHQRVAASMEHAIVRAAYRSLNKKMRTNRARLDVLTKRCLAKECTPEEAAALFESEDRSHLW